MRLLLICAAALPLGACHASWEHRGTEAAPSGAGATRSFAASGFTGVEVRGSDDVTVHSGETFAVTAQGDPKLLDKLDIRVDGTTLRIGRKEGLNWNWSGDGAKISVTMPKLTSASIAGSGNLTADRGEGDFSADVAGSGDLEVASLAGGKVDLSVAGSGNIKVSGSAQNLHANTAGSGDIDARGLKVTSASVSVAGSGNIEGSVDGDADVSIVGSGDVDLGSGARCKVSAMGSGEAHCGR